jgi:PKD repeat protein
MFIKKSHKQNHFHNTSIILIILITIATISTYSIYTKTSTATILSQSLNITAKTDKETYLLRQKITIEGNITENGTSATDVALIIQVENPKGTMAYRTLTIGNPEEMWPINISNIFLMDSSNNLINIVKTGTLIQACMTIYNWQTTPREVFATVTIFDATMVPIQSGFWKGTIDPEETKTLRFSIYIEKWACPGKALLCGNIYNKEPKNGGIAYTLEKAVYFYISRTEQGLSESIGSPPTATTTPGFFTTYVRLPPDPPAGQYTLYIISQKTPIDITSTTLTFNVQQSYGYPPQASFIFWPATPYENMTVNFDASSSTPEGFNDTIIKYEWDFGDGTPKVIKTGTPTNPPDPTTTHKYLNAGRYIITLNVTDNEGLWSTTSKPITIYPEFGPTANFTYTPLGPRVNQTITFNASNSQTGWSKTLGDYSPIINYNWNFSDGTIIDTPNPTITHNYAQPGNYTVILKITDSVGRTSTTSKIIQVYNVTATPWDVNSDGIVDIEDLYTVALHYGLIPTDPNWDPRCDVNSDGIVDIEDLYIVALHYGETYP